MPNKKKLLILDYCPVHYTEETLNFMEKKGLYYVFIPKRLTMVLQPLDRSINFPFKKYLKQKFSEFLFENEDSIIKEKLSESRICIVKDIIKIWFGKKEDNNEYISPEIIIKSFLITSISNCLDGSEDEIFDGYYVINRLLDDNNKEKNEISNEDEASSINSDEEIDQDA